MCSQQGRLRALIGLLIFIFGLTGLAVQPAVAQTQTGEIFGKVVDGSGAVLPGATVTVESPALIQPQAVATGPSGGYRIPALPIGTYTVRFELPGFRTLVREGIRITTGFSAEIDGQLQISTVEETITVSGESPIVDTTAVRTGETFSKEMLEYIPSARDPWVILEQTPGIVMDRQNVGGSESGQQSSFTVHGGNTGNTMWNVDGVTITDMAATGSSPTYYDFDSFEEIQIQTGGNDASLETGGVSLNLITKSGSNALRGSGRLFGITDELQSNNITEALFAEGADAGNPLQEIRDFGAEFGGPIVRNRAWFWGGYGKQDIKVGVLGFYKPTPECAGAADFTFDRLAAQKACLSTDLTVLENYNAKIQYQPAAAHKFTFLYTRGDKIRNARGASPTTAIESTFRQSGPTNLYKAAWQWIVSDGMTWENQYAYTDGGFVLDFHDAPLEDVQPLVDIDTGNLSRSNQRSGPFIRPQYEFKSDVNLFLSNLLGGDHSMKFGARWRSTPFDSFAKRGGGVTARVDAGAPVEADFYRDSASLREMSAVSAYFNDSWKRGRVRLNLGVRVDYQDDRAKPADVPANPIIPDILPALAFPGADSGVTFTDWSPRLGATYDLLGTGKTVAKASFAIYYGQGIFTGGTLNPVGESRVRYAWTDRNGDLFVQRNEIDTSRILSRSNYNIDDPTSVVSPNQVDQDLRNDRTREVIVGLDHELMSNFAVGVSYINRRYDDFQWSPTMGVSADNYVPVTFTQPCGNDTCDNATYTVTYYQLPFTLPSGVRLTNSTEYRDFNGVELTARKRYTRRWLLNSSLALGSTPGHRPPGSFLDPTNTPFEDGAQDNAQNARWIFKLSGMGALPWGINASAFLNGRQGFPFIRTIRTPTRAGGIGRIDAKFEPDAVSRYADLWQFDARVEKAFRIRQLRLTASADVFNLFNSNTVLDRDGRQNVSSANRVFAVLSPRVARFGLRFNF
jgi:hypothetical protein